LKRNLHQCHYSFKFHMDSPGLELCYTKLGAGSYPPEQYHDTIYSDWQCVTRKIHLE
jgi:hypothetical protein